MKINDWPCNERPREKLIQNGASHLSDAELIAICLRTGTQGKTALDIARELLNHFGSFRALLNAEPKAFYQFPGCGIAKYTQLQAAYEISKRASRENIQHQPALQNPQETYHYLTAEFAHFTEEVFGCLFLDNQHRPIQFEKLFFGTINGTAIHPRVIVKHGLKHNAAAIILAHNHPSGHAKPSEADFRATKEIIAALALFDIRVLDHLIIADAEIFSFLEHRVL